MLERTSGDHPVQTLSAKSKQGWSDQKASKHVLISWTPPRTENPLLLSAPVPVFVPHDGAIEKSLLFYLDFLCSSLWLLSHVHSLCAFKKSLNPPSVSSDREVTDGSKIPPSPLHLLNREVLSATLHTSCASAPNHPSWLLLDSLQYVNIFLMLDIILNWVLS